MAFVPNAPSTLGAAIGALFATSDFIAGWTRFLAGTDAALPVVTPNAGRAPDGTQTATRIVLNRGTGNGTSGKYSILRKSAIPGAPGVNTDSIYLALYPGAAPAKVDLRAFIPSITETNKVVTVTDQWQRFDVQTPILPASGLHDFDLLLWDNSQLPGVPTQTADILAWGFRVDAGPTPQGIDYSQSHAGTISVPAIIGWTAALFALFGGR